MSSPQQTQWRDAKRILDASGQPIEPVAFDRYEAHVGAPQGAALNHARRPAAARVRPLPQPPRTLPRPIPGFLDREQEQAQIGQSLARRRAVDLHGPTGAGKTALIGQSLAGLPPSRFPDGTVYLRAKGETYDDLLQDLVKQFYDAGRDPVHFTENEVRGHLAGKQALIAVDDADGLDEDDAEALLNVLPKCALVVSGVAPRLLQSTGVSLAGLPHDQAVALFERTYGQATPPDRPTVEAICRALGDVPKAILKTARMAAQRQVSLAQALQEVQAQARQQDPVGQATWMLGFHLSDGERRTLAGLAAPGGPTVAFDALATITQLDRAKLQNYLARLQKMALVWSTDSRYGLDEGLLPHIRRMGVDEALQARAAHYYLQQAGQLRRHSQDPDEANVVAALDYFYQHGQWREVIQIARDSDRYLATAGRWGSWRKQLGKALHAARQSGDRAAEAWAQNQLGIIALGAGGTAAAQGLFQGALAVWRALGDPQGATIARWNLQMLLTPPPPPHKGKPDGKPGGGSSPLPGILGGVAAVLVVVLIILIAIIPDEPTPPPPPPPATTRVRPATEAPPPTTRVPPTTVAPPPTTVVAPDVEIQLAAGCGETFAPGDELEILLTSSAAGVVEVSWSSPGGAYESLFAEEVSAGQIVRQGAAAPEIEGKWVLEADLNDGQAHDACDFTIEVPIEPQVQVWLAEGCGGTYDPGQTLTVRLRSNFDGVVSVYRVEPGGQPDRQFSQSIDAGETAERTWDAPSGEGSWTLIAELEGEEARDQCSFEVEAPQVWIEMDGDCNQEHEQDTQTLVTVWSNRSGQVDVYLVVDDYRQYLFSETVLADRTASRSWTTDVEAGDWGLEADLNDGRATDRCDFTVANESVPPAIEDVWIETMEDPTCPGDDVFVYAHVYDDSGLAQVLFVSRPPGGYWSSIVMETIDDETYRYAMTAYTDPGTTYYVYAEDVHENSIKSAEHTYAVESCVEIIEPAPIPVDDEAPAVTDVILEPQSPISSQDIIIRATIIDDDSGVNFAEVWYRNAWNGVDFGAWTTMRMDIFWAEETLYVVNIGDQPAGTLQYWIRAEDNAGNRRDVGPFTETIYFE